VKTVLAGQYIVQVWLKAYGAVGVEAWNGLAWLPRAAHVKNGKHNAECRHCNANIWLSGRIFKDKSPIFL
jgi:hypothetical protein